MKSGLLWFDSSSDFLGDKIERAAKRYKEKFGVSPDIAMVNPQMLQDKPAVKIKNIRIEPKSTIMPNHIWLGLGK